MILFADDLCLLAPTRAALNKLIQKCASYCNEHGLTFNAKKSKILVFSKNNVDHERLLPISLNGDTIEYCHSVKYLGTQVVSDKGLSFSASKDLSSFYHASNAILRAVTKPSLSIFFLFLSFCRFTADEMKEHIYDGDWVARKIPPKKLSVTDRPTDMVGFWKKS